MGFGHALILGVDDVAGQTVLGDAVAQHAAQLGQALVDGHLVAAAGQLVGAGHAGGTRADHGDLLVAGLARVQGRSFQVVLEGVVAEEALHGVDGDGAVLLILAQ